MSPRKLSYQEIAESFIMEDYSKVDVDFKAVSETSSSKEKEEFLNPNRLCHHPVLQILYGNPMAISLV